jgi:hypothetical protein
VTKSTAAMLGTAALISVAAILPAGEARATEAICTPNGTLQGTVVHFCGPATARLSVFPGVTFKGGTCSTRRDGSVTFKLAIGTRTQDARHNKGLPYFGMTVTGPLSNPTGGGVIAYSNGKRWGGAGTSFQGNAKAGSFRLRGINGSSGTASGSFKC